MGSNFKWKYSGKGKPASDVFNDKWGLALKENGWGKGGKRWTKNWLEREQAYKELMFMTGQKLVIVGGGEGGMEMTTAGRTTRTRTRFWRTTGGGRRRRRRWRRRRTNNILFRRTMLMSLIGWISSTGA